MVVALIAALVLAAGMGYYWLVARAPAREAGQPAPATKAAPSKAPASKSAPTKMGGRFAAVEIRLRSNACRVAQELEGQRFLAKDAPSLPLPNCSAAKCSCSFSKLPDRRTDGRRLDFGGLSASQFLQKNRRGKRDRRRATEGQS